MLGDYIDVGNNSFKVLKTLFDLQKEIGDKNMNHGILRTKLLVHILV